MSRISNRKEYECEFFKEILDTINLGPTQKTVVFMLSKGFSQSEITNKLGISRQAVSEYKKKAISRFNKIKNGEKVRDVISRNFYVESSYSYDDIVDWVNELESRRKDAHKVKHKEVS